MSKKAEIYQKELEVKDPLVERIGEIGGQEFKYVDLLQNDENRTEYKHLPDSSEFRMIRDSLPRLGIVELDTGARLMVKDGTEILIPKTARKEISRILHLTHAAMDTMMLQTKSRLFWPKMRVDLETYHSQCNVQKIEFQDPRSQMKLT